MARKEVQTDGRDQESEIGQRITTFSQFQAAVNEIWRDFSDSSCGVMRCCCPDESPHAQPVIEVGLVHTPKLVSSPAFALPQDIASLQVGVEKFLTESFKELNAQMTVTPMANSLYRE